MGSTVGKGSHQGRETQRSQLRCCSELGTGQAGAPLNPYWRAGWRARLFPGEKALANFHSFLVPLAVRALWLNNNDKRMLSITLISTLGKHSSHSPTPLHICPVYVPSSENGVDNARSPKLRPGCRQCSSGTTCFEVEISPDAWKFFFFFLVSLEMTLSLNHSCLQQWGEVGGYSLEGWGANSLPQGKLSAAQAHTAVDEAGGLQDPLGTGVRAKGSLEPGQSGTLSSPEPNSLLCAFLSAHPLSKGTGGATSIFPAWARCPQLQLYTRHLCGTRSFPTSLPNLSITTFV